MQRCEQDTRAGPRLPQGAWERTEGQERPGNEHREKPTSPMGTSPRVMAWRGRQRASA